MVETLMARRGGATSLAVATGTTSLEVWQGQPPKLRPDHLYPGIGGVLEWLG